MRPVLVGLACLWLTAGAGAVAVAGRQPAQAPTATSAIWSGVYSAPQAKRGLLEYGRSCEQCHGSGGEAGATRKTCSACAGRGQVLTSRGIFSIAQTCPRCEGAGRTLDKPCRKCHGAGRAEKTTTIRLKIDHRK